MKETERKLNEILNSHAYQSMCNWNQRREFEYDVKIAVEDILEAMSELEVIHKDNTGLLYNIHYIQHATKRIDEMRKGINKFCKKDFIIFHTYIDIAIKEILISIKD